MMMRLLQRSGSQLVYDEVLPADASNPLGYFELSRVKTHKNITDELYDLCEEKTVKVLNAWLPNFLRNSSRKFFVYYMLRAPRDVIASHRRWRIAHKMEIEYTNETELMQTFAHLMNRIQSPNVVIKFVPLTEASLCLQAKT